MAIEVPKAPAVMRAKFDRPEAAGIICGPRPESVSVTSGMKKKAMAIPCTTVGMSRVSTSTLVLKR